MFQDIKITAATNWDNTLISSLSGRNKTAKYKLTEVFGSFKADFLGSARPSLVLPHIGIEDARRHIETCLKNGLSFNYLINAPSFHNQEFEEGFKKQLISHVRLLVSLGVSAITTANPVVLEIIRANFPNIHLCASTVCKIDTLRRVEWYTDLNVDRIILETDINRDFKLLKRIRKRTPLKLEVLANLQCILECPNNTYDYFCDGFSSQSDSPAIQYYYPKIKCTNEKMKHPIEFIKSPWIRPEDIINYEELGIDFVKVAGREASSIWLVNAVSAYMNGCYKGNFFDLIGNGVISSIGRIEGLTSLQPINIELDNNRLDGFIDFFINGNCTKDCKQCRHCMDFAKHLKIFPSKDYLNRSNWLLSQVRTDGH